MGIILFCIGAGRAMLYLGFILSLVFSAAVSGSLGLLLTPLVGIPICTELDNMLIEAELYLETK